MARGVDHAVPSFGSAVSGGVGGAEGGQPDAATEEASRRRLAARCPFLHQLASGDTTCLVEMRQIVAGQLEDVAPGVQVDRASVEEYVARELNVLAQMAEGFSAVAVSTTITVGDTRLHTPRTEF